MCLSSATAKNRRTALVHGYMRKIMDCFVYALRLYGQEAYFRVMPCVAFWTPESGAFHFTLLYQHGTGAPAVD